MSNALAAAALAGALGMTPADAADALSAAVARSKWRMDVMRRPDGVQVINDAYNANPESMRAALTALASMANGGRAFAVLGQMAELGGNSQAWHEEVGAFAARTGVSGLVVVGEQAAPMLAGAKSEPGWRGELLHVPDGPAAVAALAGRIRPGDTVLVKASRAVALWEVAFALASEGYGVRTILVAAGVATVLALLGTPLAIRMFTARGYGQEIREEGPAAHATKRGTPTMGGTVIIIAALIGYFVAHFATSQAPSASGLLVLLLMTGLGIVGFIDDFIKIYKQRSLGLRSGTKLAGQAVIGALFALLVLRFRDGYDLTPADAHFSFLRDFGPSIGPVIFGLWIVFMIAAMSNGVNLTDGLDGLATGAGDPGARRLRDHRHLAGPQRLHELPRAAVLLRCATRSTARSWRPRCSAPASGSCGGTPRRPGSSWATPARWRSAACWPGSRSPPAPSCCWPYSAACSCSSRCRS